MVPETGSPSNDTATVIAVGASAGTLAAICHETLGHSLGCVGAGGHITLITSSLFRCEGAPAIADAGGPIGNLVAGFSALALLSYMKASPAVRLLLVLFGALNLYWFTGQLAFEFLTQTHDDWYYLISLQVGWPGAYRVLGATVGLGGYVLVSRWISGVIRKQGGPQPHAIQLAYAAAAASAIIAGLMWRPEPLNGALQGFLTLGVAPLGLLSVARRANRDVELDTRSVPRSWLWICGGAVLFGVFLLVQAQGLGPMAAWRLSP
jgi:hypothetical protein